MTHHAYLLLGSNLGDRSAFLEAACAALRASCGPVVAASAVYETAAWGVTDQAPFLNQALCVETTLPPEAVLAAAQAAETAADRQRQERWGARTLDVDILLYDAAVLDQPDLTLPHPALPGRRFALTPLAEIAPDLRHPVLHRTVAELLADCPDPLPVTRYLP